LTRRRAGAPGARAGAGAGAACRFGACLEPCCTAPIGERRQGPSRSDKRSTPVIDRNPASLARSAVVSLALRRAGRLWKKARLRGGSRAHWRGTFSRADCNPSHSFFPFRLFPAVGNGAATTKFVGANACESVSRIGAKTGRCGRSNEISVFFFFFFFFCFFCFFFFFFFFFSGRHPDPPSVPPVFWKQNSSRDMVIAGILGERRASGLRHSFAPVNGEPSTLRKYR